MSDMQNPLIKAVAAGKPFIYFHTLLFNENILELAKTAGKSLEIDVSMDAQDRLFAGHPHEFYVFKHMAPPIICH